jgi:uncharacterized protein YifE (UPF0438 family)
MLTKWDRQLIAQHKTRYERLVSGRYQPQSQNERHFVKTFRYSLEPVTQHEIAYSRYLQERRNKFFDEIKEGKEQKKIRAIEVILDEVDAKILDAEERGDKEFSLVAGKYRSHMQSEQPEKDDYIASAFVWLNYLTESSLSKSLERWSAETFNTLSNAYTKAIDGSFADGLKAGADYVSPSMHRLVEAGHTLPDAFDKARAALENDTTIQELYGTASALLSDMSSVVGLPMFTMPKQTADEIKNFVSEFGIDEKKFADLLSYNAIEIVGSVIPALALMFGWNSKDAQKFGELVGALGITAAFAGNPLGLIVAMVGLARSFHKAKSQSVTTMSWVKSISKGGLVSSVVIASVSVIGSSVWLVLISSIIIAQVLNARGVSVNWALIGKAILLKINSAKKSYSKG